MTTYIVTLTWNNSMDFERYLRHLLMHTYTDVWLVVVDNGSEVLERDRISKALMDVPCLGSKIDLATLELNDENLGLPAAQNQAMDWIAAHDTGDYGIVMLDADTVVGEGWLDKMLSFAEDHTDVGLVGGGMSPRSYPCPVYHNPNGRWYVHEDQFYHPSGFMEGESVDFACVYMRPELVARGLRFDPAYHFYDGHDQDMCYRVRSWGYRCWAIKAGVEHYSSSVMKSRGYRWPGGGRKEWDELRERNRSRYSKLWQPFMAPARGTVEQEIEHMTSMNAKLVAEAGDRKAVPDGQDHQDV